MRILTRQFLNVLLPSSNAGARAVYHSYTEPELAGYWSRGYGGAGSAAVFDAPQHRQAYEKVITKEAKSESGLFMLSKAKQEYFCEIPED